MADVLTIVFVVLHVLWWPISKLISLLIFVLSPVWLVCSFLLLPLIHLGHAIVNVLSFPFKWQWMERIETLYVFLGTASVVGGLTGAILFLIFKFLSSTLSIDGKIVPKSADPGRTPAEFRAARREKKEEDDVANFSVDQSMDPSPVSTPAIIRKVDGLRRKGLLSQAIIEEEDSDF